MNEFYENNNLFSVIKHSCSNIDFTNHFNMSGSNILDHFIVSGNLFESAVKGLSVYHQIDNTLDHEPLLLELSLKIDHLSFARRQFVTRAAWHKVSPADLDNYRETLPGIKSVRPTLIIIERL